MTKTLMESYTEYNERLKAKGVKMLTYSCPKCGSKIETQRATRGEIWDTLATCPHCESLYMKVTTHTKVFAQIPS